jgi:hypothetical protein
MGLKIFHMGPKREALETTLLMPLISGEPGSSGSISDSLSLAIAAGWFE